MTFQPSLSEVCSSIWYKSHQILLTFLSFLSVPKSGFTSRNDHVMPCIGLLPSHFCSSLDSVVHINLISFSSLLVPWLLVPNVELELRASFSNCAPKKTEAFLLSLSVAIFGLGLTLFLRSSSLQKIYNHGFSQSGGILEIVYSPESSFC